MFIYFYIIFLIIVFFLYGLMLSLFIDFLFPDFINNQYEYIVLINQVKRRPPRALWRFALAIMRYTCGFMSYGVWCDLLWCGACVMGWDSKYIILCVCSRARACIRVRCTCTQTHFARVHAHKWTRICIHTHQRARLLGARRDGIGRAGEGTREQNRRFPLRTGNAGA